MNTFTDIEYIGSGCFEASRYYKCELLTLFTGRYLLILCHVPPRQLSLATPEVSDPCIDMLSAARDDANVLVFSEMPVNISCQNLSIICEELCTDVRHKIKML